MNEYYKKTNNNEKNNNRNNSIYHNTLPFKIHLYESNNIDIWKLLEEHEYYNESFEK